MWDRCAITGVSLLCLIAIAIAEPPPLDALPLRSEVTQGRITWRFTEPARVGQFVNGDYYVVGPVTVTATDPAPAGGRNLSVLNPAPRDHSGQAFDTRLRGHDPSRVAALPIRMNPGDLLVSSVGTEKKSRPDLFGQERNFSPILSYSILTCLPAPVPPDTFRPGYCDRDMKLYRARDLQRWRLHNLAPVEETPDIEHWARLFRQPWLDLVGFCFAAAAEYQPQYARETARAEAFATLLLNLDFPPERKEPLLINFVQYGIDLWSIVRAGEPDFTAWRANGGHGNGRKWAIVFAGLMLGDERMASPSVSHPDFRFGMDMQTAFGKSWTGADVVYAGHMGLWKGEPAGREPSHMPYEHLQPREWPTGTYQYPWSSAPVTQYTGELYRRTVNSPVWVGIALAARIMRAEPLYAHDPFFAYVDRWMTEYDAPLREKIMEQIDTQNTRHKPGSNLDFRAERFHAGRARDPFVQNMWKAYRHALPPPRTPPE